MEYKTTDTVGTFFLIPPNEEENYQIIAFWSLSKYLSDNILSHISGRDSLINLMEFARKKMIKEGYRLAESNRIYTLVSKDEKDRNSSGALQFVISNEIRQDPREETEDLDFILGETKDGMVVIGL